MLRHIIILFVVSLSSIGSVLGRTHGVTVNGTVHDGAEPLSFAAVTLTSDGVEYNVVCNVGGEFTFHNLEVGEYVVRTSYISYNNYISNVSLHRDTQLDICMVRNINMIEELVVTGVEAKGLTTSTVINRDAINLLQPSSFSDILELLPGGTSSAPSLTSANTIALREVGISSDDYSISSLGTAFLIDGARISTAANMQYTTGLSYSIGNSIYTDASVSTVNAGVDMRNISTDQIETVEIVRGIPSVKYGSLTSGLVNITRKVEATPLNARFKADGVSKLFAVSKGFSHGSNSLAFNLDYLDAKQSPTSNYENYQRISSSVRYAKNFKSGIFRSNFDYSHNIDKVHTDPNVGYSLDNSYQSLYNRFALNNYYKYNFAEGSLFKNVELRADASYELDQIKQNYLVQISSPTAIPNSQEAGVADGIYLPNSWLSDLTVDGRPLSLSGSAISNLSFNTFGARHKGMVGVEWSYDKNFGEGQVYDVNLPPSSSMSTRPRKYSDIPAMQQAGFFVEDDFTLNIGENRFNLVAGVRGSMLLGMDSQYAMGGKLYIDPRVNAKWSFPSFDIADKSATISVGGGWGRHTMFPTLLQLYPDWVYSDYVQLNYYHNNPDYRRINIKTYKEKVVNYDLQPATNDKWELNFNFTWDNHNFSVTYFNEYMDNGFRTQSNTVQVHTYNEYDSNSIDYSTLTAPPNLEDMTFEVETVLKNYSTTTNGSVIDKQGVEFAYSSKRFKDINTRVTLNGAWFRTIYENSLPIYRTASVMVDGDWLKEIGIYESNGGYRREQLTSNLMLDSYIPAIDLFIFASFQSSWFYKKQTTEYSGIPIAYVGLDGETHPYTEVEMTDYRLQHLCLSVSDSAFDEYLTPFSMDVNLKMSKKFGDMLNVSLYVNRILSLYPDYVSNGVTIKRNVTPYFGAEITFKI